MFKSIKINNLRAIKELEINNLGQVNLLVGQNNCGKTTILEALFFLIGATNPKLPINANSFRGLPFLHNQLWPTFFYNLDSNSSISISGLLRENDERQDLTIRAKIQEGTMVEPVVSNTSSSLEASDSVPSFVPNGLELFYTSSKDNTEKTATKVFIKGNDLIAEGTKERFPRGIFVSSGALTDWRPRFAVVQRKKQVLEVLSLLKEIEPQISDLRLNEIGLLEADINLTALIPINLMGGGIIKMLSVSLAMLDSKDGIVLIDEIENGLHHSAQQKLWKAIFSWAQNLNVQVFATTHSDECIRAFKDSVDSTLFESEAKLFRIERKDEKFRAVEYTKDILAESLESKWEVR